MDHGEKERKKQDLALEKIQGVRDELNNGRIKYLTLILSKKGWLKRMKQGDTSTMLEKWCWSTIKHLQQERKLLFVTVSLDLATYVIYKYLK